jgi:hypothetical protein
MLYCTSMLQTFASSSFMLCTFALSMFMPDTGKRSYLSKKQPARLLQSFCMREGPQRIYINTLIGKRLLKIGTMLRKAMFFHFSYLICV